MADLTREEFLTHVQLLHDGIQGVHVRLDTLNGRTRAVEQQVAVHEDRFDAQKDSSKAYTHKAVGAVGTLLALLGAAWEYLKHGQ